MKLTIGENIRNYRKRNDLTQEDFADRLGVTVQSVSRWENGATYPDIELLPAIAGLLTVTMDELLGMPEIEKEKRAEETFDELRRECLRQDCDPNRITELLRDIRRNYLDSSSAWRPWVEGNDRAFRDPAVLPEVRLLAEAYLEKHPMNPHVIETMAEVDDEEHLEAFLETYTTEFDCSRRALLFDRYLRRGDEERFEPERKCQLHDAIDRLLSSRYLTKLHASSEERCAAYDFKRKLLSLIRRDAVDDGPDMWTEVRMGNSLECAAVLLANGDKEEALLSIAEAVHLLEETMKITEETQLSASCRFLDEMEWRAEESWHAAGNDPDAPLERAVFIKFQIGNLTQSYGIYPSRCLNILRGAEFEPLRGNAEFEALCSRVEALIETREKE